MFEDQVHNQVTQVSLKVDVGEWKKVRAYCTKRGLKVTHWASKVLADAIQQLAIAEENAT